MDLNQLTFWQQLEEIWVKGGSLMPALAAISLFLFAGICELWFYLRRHNYARMDENEWAHWVDKPEDGKGEIGRIIKFLQDGNPPLYIIRSRLQELRGSFLPMIERRLIFLNILIGVSPLTGLLGTVKGMLVTFVGISVSSGGNAVDLVAGGIKEALITTEVGLVIAIPGYVMVYFLKKGAGELDHFFMRLEILIVQKVQRQHTLAKAV